MVLSNKDEDLSAVAVLGITILLFLVVYFRTRRQRALPAATQDLELIRRPTVLLIYADDCDAHSECVAALGRLLRVAANAIVHLDQEDLEKPSMTSFVQGYVPVS